MFLGLNLALKELFGHKKFSIIFICNVCIGLIAFLCLDAIRTTFEHHIESHSRDLQTSDLSIQARRMITPDEKEKARVFFNEDTIQTEVLNVYSMVASESKSRLAELQAIEEHFPLYSQIVLDHQDPILSKSPKDICSQQTVWVYPEVLNQLGISVGDQIKIGLLDFKVSSVVIDDAQLNISQASFAPKIYIGKKFLEKSGLLQKGSTLRHTIHFKIDQALDHLEVKNSLEKSLEGSGIRVSSPLDRTEQSNQNASTTMMSYVLDYLGLVALSALFLAAIGIAYFYFSYFTKRLKDMSIFLSLGMSPGQVANSFYTHLVLLGTMAGGASVLATALLLPLSESLLSDFLPKGISLSLQPRTIFIGLCISLVATLLSCFPFARRIAWLRPAHLFQEQSSQSLNLSASEYLSFIPLLSFYWALAIWQAKSFVVGSGFTLGLILATLSLSGGFFLLQRLLIHLSQGRRSFASRQALLQITRKPFHGLITFVAIGLGVLLINLVSQIQSSLSQELSEGNGSPRPSFFMFDIQDDQTEKLKTFVEQRKSTLQNLSPMIRARITEHNGQLLNEANKMNKVAAQSDELSTREYNLSYRSGLDSTERLVAGDAIETGSKDYAQISLEQRFAARLGIGLGDQLKFDVSGIEIIAKVVNLRAVKWTSFQPNFFIQFEDGVLNEAPKTWVAALPMISKEEKMLIQNDLVDQFPNIAVIDVERLVAKALAASETMSLMLSVMAGMTLLLGIFILVSISHFQSQVRLWDLNLLKALGCQYSRLKLSYCLEFAGLSASAAVCGSLMALIFGAVVSKSLFNSIPPIGTPIPFLSILVVSLCGIICSLYFSSQSIKGSSAPILGGRDN